MPKPIKSEKPKTNKFRLDSSEQFFRFERPTPVIIANMTQNKPPTTGSGIVTKMEENLPQQANASSKNPATYFRNEGPSKTKFVRLC